MLLLFLSEPNWKPDTAAAAAESGEQWISLLSQLESVIWSVMMASGGRSESRLWLSNTVSSIGSLTPRQYRDLFVKLLRTKPTKRSLASQLWQMIFEKHPRLAGRVLARRSRILENFFQGNPMRIMQWFSHFGVGGTEHRKGAKALSQFAFVNRDICWEELEWKGKHGQSPAMVATKPHYFLDLDVLRTVENFIDNVPEFWSSVELAESLKDGEIFSIDMKFFVEFFVVLMYKDDARDVWEAVDEFLMQESFSSLCHHLLITLEEREFCAFLELLRKHLSPQMGKNDFGRTSSWLELLLSRSSDFDSIDQLLLLNAVIHQGRQLLKLVCDEEFGEEEAKVRDIVSRIGTLSSSYNSLVPLLSKCFKMKVVEAIKFLALHSWVLHYALSKECKTPESWESLFLRNGITFKKSDKYALLHDNGLSENDDSESDDGVSIKRKHRKKKKKKKSRKKRRDFSDDENFDSELLDVDPSDNGLDEQTKTESWLLSTDAYSASWTNADLPEHLSKICFSTWMKWNFARWTNLD
ncbi:hypothetical protein Tsubulata_034265 [Turnera subulata]|uniref:Uncharacterized protein n=1 Tax=Turnera subulata TaxID=218843 RepID=A0A9Q0GGB3_9ROSI|nr:hypothetical protein Tsubulata_034265 [Turnera subulata]